MTEEWRSVVGYEGLYEVSSLGSVRTLGRRADNERGNRNGRQAVRGRLLSPSGPRYLRVTLTKDGLSKRLMVHQLVLETFVGLRPAGMVARHFPNRDVTDNRAANLRWGTPTENQADRVAHGTSGYGRGNPHRTPAETEAAIRRDYGSIEGRYTRGRMTQRTLAQKYGVSLACVNRILRGGQGCLS